jgi:hypothetical protein
MLGSFLCGFQFDTDRGRHRGAGFTTLSVTTKQASNSSTDHGGGNRRSSQSARRESNQIERPDRLRGFPAAKGAFHPRPLAASGADTRWGAWSMQRSVYIHMVMIGQKRRKGSASPAKNAECRAHRPPSLSCESHDPRRRPRCIPSLAAELSFGRAHPARQTRAAGSGGPNSAATYDLNWPSTSP